MTIAASTVGLRETGIGIVGTRPVAELCPRVQEIEALGFGDIWIADERFYRDVYCCMTAAALSSSSVRIGTCVTDPYIRHPALTAVAMATLDELSGGRAVVGIGAGLSGFAALGIERRRPAPAIREAVHVMRALWRNEVVSLEGDHMVAREAALDFRCTREIPVYVAGRGPNVLAVGGEVGDGVIVGTFASPVGLRYALDRIERGAARAGRTLDDIDLVSWLYLSVDDDPERAHRAVSRGVAVALSGTPGLAGMVGLELPAAARRALEQRAYTLSAMDDLARLIPPEMRAHFAISGTVEDVRRGLAAVLGMGVRRIAIWPLVPEGGDELRMLATLAHDVLPLLASGSEQHA